MRMGRAPVAQPAPASTEQKERPAAHTRLPWRIATNLGKLAFNGVKPAESTLDETDGPDRIHIQHISGRAPSQK